MQSLPGPTTCDLDPQELLQIRGGGATSLLSPEPIICYWPLRPGGTLLSSARRTAVSGPRRI